MLTVAWLGVGLGALMVCLIILFVKLIDAEADIYFYKTLSNLLLEEKLNKSLKELDNESTVFVHKHTDKLKNVNKSSFK